MLSVNSIPINNVYENSESDVIEPSSGSLWVEIKKLLWRMKWCEDTLKSGVKHHNDDLERRIRDLEGTNSVFSKMAYQHNAEYIDSLHYKPKTSNGKRMKRDRNKQARQFERARKKIAKEGENVK